MQGEVLALQVPHYRLDIEGTADVAEEIARIYGYDNIPMTLMPESPSDAVKTRRQYLMDSIRECMVGMGAYEASTYSFQSEDVYRRMRLPAPNVLRIINPLGEDQNVMRTSMLPGLLGSLAHNQSHKVAECMLFETGRGVFDRAETGGSHRTPPTSLCGWGLPGTVKGRISSG